MTFSHVISESRRLSFRASLLFMLALLFVALPARAQPKRTLAQLDAEVAALKTQVAEIAAQSPNVTSAAQEASSKVAHLEQELAKLRRQQASVPEAVDRLDKLAIEAGSLRQDLEALRTDVADIAQPSAAAGGSGGVTYDNGFRWRSDGGDYGLLLGGFTQIRYQAVNRFSNGDVDQSSLHFRRARVQLRGHLGSDDVTFRVMTDFLDEQALFDYWLNYRWRDELQVFVGQQRARFTREFITGSPRLLFTERSRSVQGLRYDRSVGVGVHGQVLDDRGYYFAGLNSGAGRNNVDDNIDFTSTARLEFAVLGDRPTYTYGDLARSESPTLVLGGGFVHDLTPVPTAVGGLEDGVGNRDVDGDGDIDNIRVLSASADLLFRWKGLELALEGMWRNEDWGTILDNPDNFDLGNALEFDDSRNYLAFVGALSYVIPPKVLDRDLVVGVRAGHTRLPLLGVDGRASTVPMTDRLVDIDAAVQLFNKRGYRWLGLHGSFFNFNARGDGPDPALDKEFRIIAEGQFYF